AARAAGRRSRARDRRWAGAAAARADAARAAAGPAAGPGARLAARAADGPPRLFFAEDPHEQEDAEPGQRGEDERIRGRDADGAHPEPQVNAENEAPEERLDARVQTRRSQTHSP